MTMIQSSLNIDTAQAELVEQSPQEILSHALKSFDRIAVSFSGAEDVILIDMAHKINPDVRVFSLDTGRLHSETYQLLNRVRNHYMPDDGGGKIPMIKNAVFMLLIRLKILVSSYSLPTQAIVYL